MEQPGRNGKSAGGVKPLSTRAFNTAVRELAAKDADLGRVVETYGVPKIRRREPGFATLVLLILEQQVSLASARATFEKLSQTAGAITPDAVLALDDAALRSAGLSRQKARYARLLAEEAASETLDVDGLARLDDDAVRARLTKITGIGPWTADVYLLMALKRADIWPVQDLALAVAAHEVKGLPARPGADELLKMGEAWRPWRTVAARILWHYYLNTKRLKPGKGA